MSVRGNRATDSQGKEHSLTTAKPVGRDAQTEGITVRLRGSTQTEGGQKESLGPFADALREIIQTSGRTRMTLGEAATRLKTGARKAQFEAAMRGVKSFSAFLKLFPGVFKLEIPAAGGNDACWVGVIGFVCLSNLCTRVPQRFPSLPSDPHSAGSVYSCCDAR